MQDKKQSASFSFYKNILLILPLAILHILSCFSAKPVITPKKWIADLTVDLVEAAMDFTSVLILMRRF